jgi:hypothetical protein
VQPSKFLLRNKLLLWKEISTIHHTNIILGYTECRIVHIESVFPKYIIFGRIYDGKNMNILLQNVRFVTEIYSNWISYFFFVFFVRIVILHFELLLLLSLSLICMNYISFFFFFLNQTCFYSIMTLQIPWFNM